MSPLKNSREKTTAWNRWFGMKSKKRGLIFVATPLVATPDQHVGEKRTHHFLVIFGRRIKSISQGQDRLSHESRRSKAIAATPTSQKVSSLLHPWEWTLSVGSCCKCRAKIESSVYSSDHCWISLATRWGFSGVSRHVVAKLASLLLVLISCCDYMCLIITN